MFTKVISKNIFFSFLTWRHTWTILTMLLLGGQKKVKIFFRSSHFCRSKNCPPPFWRVKKLSNIFLVNNFFETQKSSTTFLAGQKTVQHFFGKHFFVKSKIVSHIFGRSKNCQTIFWQTIFRKSKNWRTVFCLTVFRHPKLHFPSSHGGQFFVNNFLESHFLTISHLKWQSLK